MRITKAIFPVAGFGTRFLPVTKAQSKAMLPIVDKPVIQYLVEEAVASGIEEIIFVTGRGERAIEDHFDYSEELEKTLHTRGKSGLAKSLRALAEMAKFVYVKQREPLGDGHAVLCSRDIIGDEPCAVMFGDDIVDSRTPALRQLIKVYEATNAPVIALERIAKKDTKKYGIVLPRALKTNKRMYEIKGLVEKPAPSRAPSALGIIGKYIITPDVFDALSRVKRGADGEIRLISAFKLLLGRTPIYGYEIEGKRYDTGDKLGYLQAVVDFALKRKDLGPALRKHLISVR